MWTIFRCNYGILLEKLQKEQKNKAEVAWFYCSSQVLYNKFVENVKPTAIVNEYD